MITKTIKTNVSRGLFEAHKTIFAFLICTSINKNYGKIQEGHWNILLRGAGPVSAEQERVRPTNPDNKLISSMGWDLLYFTECSDAENFGSLTNSIITNFDEWQDWATKANPHNEPLPLEWNDKVNNFERLLILKAFRPEKLLFAFTNYVVDEIGQFYVENPPASMEVVYADTDVKTPLIFVLSQGADPTATLIKFAKDKDFSEKLNVISLGQG
jgi:dynein heavy chain